MYRSEKPSRQRDWFEDDFTEGRSSISSEKPREALRYHRFAFLNPNKHDILNKQYVDTYHRKKQVDDLVVASQKGTNKNRITASSDKDVYYEDNYQESGLRCPIRIWLIGVLVLILIICLAFGLGLGLGLNSNEGVCFFLLFHKFYLLPSFFNTTKSTIMYIRQINNYNAPY